MEKPKLSIDPETSTSYINLYENRQFDSTPILNKKNQTAAVSSTSNWDESSSHHNQVSNNYQQKSLKEVERLLNENSTLHRDCNQYNNIINRKAMHGLRTQCPLLKRESVV